MARKRKQTLSPRPGRTIRAKPGRTVDLYSTTQAQRFWPKGTPMDQIIKGK